MPDDDDRIDLSVLDPSRDEVRWARTIASLAQQAAAARAPGLTQGILAWARPVLLAAAATALLVWGAALLVDRRAPTPAPVTPDPAVALLDYASSEELPATPDLLATLGGNVDG
jgi:hypothetical protein